MKQKLLFGTIGIGAVIIGGIVTIFLLSQGDSGTEKISTKERTSVSLIDKAFLGGLPKVDRSNVDATRLVDGMTPPTNTWFSGLALQKDPKPAFSYPNSVRPTNTGFELGLPNVSATSESIIGPHSADMVVTIEGAMSYKVTRYDELTVDLGYYSASSAQLATVTLAAGSPYVFVNAKQDTSLSYTGTSEEKDNARMVKRGDSLYGLRTDGQQADGSLTMPTGSSATVFSVPNESAFPTVAKYALNPVTSGSVSYGGRGSQSTTTLQYATSNDQPTLIARLPHQKKTSQSSTPVNYESILGTLTTTAAQSLEYQVPTVELKDSLSVGELSDNERTQLTTQLKKDVDSLPEARNDTYFGGKQLQRTAQLLLLADQLGARQQKQTLQDILNQRLDQWLSSEGAFQFDTKAHAIVGKETSFGADTDVNDHHFHYGYVIYAAVVLDRFDNSFLDRHGAAVNLLVADIANYKPGETLPQRRNYDPYFGHSWASGTSPFNDGNNQESTSEAINAWTAVGLWAQRTSNETLADQATWMLSNETATAKEYWLKQPTEPGYDAPIASIVWGGKREYKTFFSDDPNPKLSILLLPLSPTMQEYAASIDAASFAGTDASRPYGDYLLMADPDATLEQAQALPDTAIDDGNSRTYLYAYIMTN